MVKRQILGKQYDNFIEKYRFTVLNLRYFLMEIIFFVHLSEMIFFGI